MILVVDEYYDRHNVVHVVPMLPLSFWVALIKETGWYGLLMLSSSVPPTNPPTNLVRNEQLQADLYVKMM